MKVKQVVAGVLASLGVSAFALPAISLPAGPIFIKFTNLEQIAINGANTGYANEINWGILTVETLRIGTVQTPNDLIGTGSPIFFVDQITHNAQITGIFYGIESAVGPAASVFPATGGFLDLYWRDQSVYSLSDISDAGDTALSNRTAQDTFTGWTDGEFLARVMFDSGIDPINSTVTIAGDTFPTTSGFSGTATSYGSIDVGAGGLWAEAMDTNWFNSPYGQRDMRFKNSYDNDARWNGDCSISASAPTAPCVLGATSDDPAQAFSVPTPGTLALTGLALLGLAGISRRRVR